MNLLIKIACLLCIIAGIYVAFRTSEYYSYIGSDFTQDYVAGENLRAGASIYGEAITSRAKEVHGFLGIENFHPPFLALPYALLSLLPFTAAHIVLGVLSIAALIVSVYLVLRGFGQPARYLLYLLPLLLFWHPFFETLALGQSSLVLALVVTLAWYFGRQGKQGVCGACIGAAAMIKLFPAFLWFLSVRRNEWRAALVAAVLFTLGVVITAIVVGIEAFQIYASEIAPKDGAVWGLNISNITLHGAIIPCFTKTVWSAPFVESSTLGSVVLWSAILVVLFFAVQCTARKNTSDTTLLYDEQFSLFLVSALLLSPVCWTHNLSLLLPVYGLFLFRSTSRSELKIFIIAFILLSLPSYALVRELQEILGHPHLHGIYLLMAKAPLFGVLVLWGLLIARLKRKQS